MSPRLEKFEQADGLRLLASLGARTYVLGTRRPRTDYQGTCQTPGVSDVIAFLPAPRYGALPAGQTRRLLCWEAKSATGRLSAAQRDFADLCQWAGVAHVAGDLNALIAWLVGVGYLRADQLPHDRRPAGVPRRDWECGA